MPLLRRTSFHSVSSLGSCKNNFEVVFAQIKLKNKKQIHLPAFLDVLNEETLQARGFNDEHRDFSISPHLIWA